MDSLTDVLKLVISTYNYLFSRHEFPYAV